jgi:hypothetical protein
MVVSVRDLDRREETEKTEVTVLHGGTEKPSKKLAAGKDCSELFLKPEAWSPKPVESTSRRR